MTEIEEALLRKFIDDLLASRGKAQKVIIENIVTFIKKVVARHSAQSS